VWSPPGHALIDIVVDGDGKLAAEISDADFGPIRAAVNAGDLNTSIADSLTNELTIARRK
jgi:hypothetical protein